MKKQLFKFGSRTTLWGLEALAILAGLILLVVGVLLWRLSSGPLDVSFANKYIEQALHDPVSGYSVSLEKSVMHWPDFNQPLYLSVENITLIKDGKDVVDIDKVALGLASSSLLVGKVEPVSIVLTSPSLNLVRTVDNEVLLSFDDWVQEEKPLPKRPEDKEEASPIMMVLQTLAAPQDEIDNSSPLGKLEIIEIKEARLVMEDHAIGVTWLLAPLDVSFVRDDEGLVIASALQMPGTSSDNPADLHLNVVYRRAEEDLLANVIFTDLDPHIISGKVEELAFLDSQDLILDGEIELSFSDKLDIREAQMDLKAHAGSLQLDGVYDRPLPYESMRIHAFYDRANKILNLREASIDTGEVQINVTSLATITDDVIDAPFVIEIPKLAQEDIGPIWPDALRGEGAEEWLVQRLSKGSFEDLYLSFDLLASAVPPPENAEDDFAYEQEWSVDVRNIMADFDIHSMDIDYRSPLAPVTKASGTGHFEKDVLEIAIKEANLLDLDVKNGLVSLDKIIEGDGHANIALEVGGSLPTVFKYIASEPLALDEEKIGLDTKAVKGRADLGINISFPTVKDFPEDQLKVVVEGKLSEVSLPDVVKDLDLAGGPFNVDIRSGKVTIDGNGKLEGRDVNFKWSQYFNPEDGPFASQVTAKATMDNALRARLGVNLDDWVDGAIATDLTYTEYQDGRSVADIKGDLKNARLKIEPLNYVDPVNTPGSVSLQAVFRNGYVEEVSKLQIDSDVKVSNGKFVFRVQNGESDLHRGNIPSFALGENKFSIEFEIGASDLVKLSIDGAFLDGRPFLGDDEGEDKSQPYDGPPVMASVNVSQLRTRDTHTIRNAKLYVDLNREGFLDQLEMDAVAGKGAIYLRMKPDDRGVQTMRLEADDAGATLRAFDMYENVRGGTLALYGAAESPNSNRIIIGTAQLNNFKVVDAPVLARLINAMSLSGILQLFNDEGITFSKLESKFTWQIRRGGDLYLMKDGRTSGASIGLTFDGKIDKAQGIIDVSGTIVPVSGINNMVGNIPIIGDILTGGSGALIAATYSIEGPVKKPEVSVNPLAALTPGILRKILFEN